MLTRSVPFFVLSLLFACLGCRDEADPPAYCAEVGCECFNSESCGIGLICNTETLTCAQEKGEPGGSDGGSGCVAGTLGCACDGGVCSSDPDVGPLECVNDRCIPDDCPDGELGCECTVTCSGNLSCLDGVCVDLSAPECLQPYNVCHDNDLGDLGECCEGTLCLGYQETNTWGCSPTCSAHSDCATDCCVSLSEPEGLFCAPTAAQGCTKCINTCLYADDGDCDDGGPGSDFSLCELGTDCGDCGPR